MEMVGVELSNMSKLYSVNKCNDFGPTSVFSETNQGKVAVEGTVPHKLDMKPKCCFDEYSNLYQERNIKHLAEDRKKQVIGISRRELLTPKPELVKSKTVSAERRFRVRGDRSKVEAKVFELFEIQPKWTIKQLEQQTNQPRAFLKEILKDLCVCNARAGYTHELKPEYKKIR